MTTVNNNNNTIIQVTLEAVTSENELSEEEKLFKEEIAIVKSKMQSVSDKQLVKFNSKKEERQQQFIDLLKYLFQDIHIPIYAFSDGSPSKDYRIVRFSWSEYEELRELACWLQPHQIFKIVINICLQYGLKAGKFKKSTMLPEYHVRKLVFDGSKFEDVHGWEFEVLKFDDMEEVTEGEEIGVVGAVGGTKNEFGEEMISVEDAQKQINEISLQ